MKSLLFLFGFLLQGLLGDGFADEVFRKISIEEGNACYRLLNGTHQFGCNADPDKVNGVLVKVEKEGDFENLKSCYRSIYPDYNGNFWIMLPVRLITRNTISTIRSSNCTSGLVLYEGDDDFSIDDMMEGSHDSECPNAFSNYYNKRGRSEYCKTKPNKNGAITPGGLRNIDWNLQMVLIQNKSEIAVLNQCYSLFNDPADKRNGMAYPYCGMTFKLSSLAAGNSAICYRRGLSSAKFFEMNIDSPSPTALCSPLYGGNIIAWPVPVTSTDVLKEEPRYMAIGGRLDSFGLIPDASSGEITVLTSLISVISAAKSIASRLDVWSSASKKSNRYLMFTMFNGESFDYIGSSAIVYRIRNGQFPLPVMNMTQLRSVNLAQIDYFLELQQIGSGRDRKMYAHVDAERYREKKSSVDSILRSVDETLRIQGRSLEMPAEDSYVPPSSWHSFAKYDTKIQAIVLSPFKEFYEYRRYNSMLDKNKWDPKSRTETIDQIVAAASSVLTASANYVGIQNSSEITSVDRNLVATLFDCLVVSDQWFSCDFMKKLNGGRYRYRGHSYATRQKSTYISVDPENPYRQVVSWLFIFALGSSRETLNVKNKNSCMDLSEHQAVYSYEWQPNPYTGNFSCLRSSIQYIHAQSPAFEIEGYNLAHNRTFSTWTESMYSIESVKLFLLEDHSFDYTVLLVAVLVALLSFFAVGRCSESTFVVDEGDQAAESGEPL